MFRRLRDRDELRFFLHWLRRPGRVGAVVLSGPALAAPVLQHLEARIDRRTGAATPSLPVFQCLTGPRGGMPRTSRSTSGVAGPAGFSQ